MEPGFSYSRDPKSKFLSFTLHTMPVFGGLESSDQATSDRERRLRDERGFRHAGPEQSRLLTRRHLRDDRLVECVVGASEGSVSPDVLQSPREEAIEIAIRGRLVVLAA